jgi:hypothetical protein
MSENKRFKSFRNELTESEYKEVLTGYPNRGIDTDVGPVKFDQSMLMKVNAVLNALNRYSYQHPNEAFIKIKTRLNVFMLDFPWTPYLWNNGGVGNVALTVTRYGRVDGVDAITGEIRVDGKANNPDGFMEFTLSVQMEVGEDGLYRMTAKLMPKADVLPESVEQVDESGKLYTHLHHPKGPAVVNKKGKTVKVHKTETAARKHAMKEEAEPIEEMLKAGDKVKVPHKGKMVRGKIVRHDNGGSGKAQQHGGGYVVDVGEHGSITVPSHKVVREAAEQIDELSKKTKDAYVAKRGSQLSSMLSGHTRGKQLTGKQQANAVKGIKRAMGVKEEAEQIDELSAKTKRSYYEKSVRSSNKMRDELDGVRDEQERKAQDFARSSEGQMGLEAARANVRHMDGGEKLAAREAELRKKIKQRERGQQQAKKTVKEALVGGQKRLDVNKNKRLDSQDFAMLRSKKKPMKEYIDMASGMALQAPAPGDAMADKSGKGKRFHKKAVKMAEAAMAKARKPKQKTPQKSDRSGAANVIGRQSAIKHTLSKHDMRW